jgi:hypothetical protein
VQTRLQQLQLLQALVHPAGWRHVGLQALLSVVSSLLDIAGLGLAVSLLLSSGSGSAASSSLLKDVSPASSLGLLVMLIIARGPAAALPDGLRAAACRAV